MMVGPSGSAFRSGFQTGPSCCVQKTWWLASEEKFRRNLGQVSGLLKRLGFSLRTNAKTREGTSHPDRNAQFEHINAEVKAFRLLASRHLGRYQEEGCAAEARKEFVMN